jgi:hypothetical protein
MSKLPAIKDLYSSKELAVKNDEFTALMNQPPSNDWVKEHPFIKGYKYLPIERVEFLLKSIFKKYRIEILREGTSFNGVYVVVRVHYLHPISNEMEYHDGIGAVELQTKKGTSPSDLSNINNGALGMAFPVAKSRAVKDAADHLGKLFGSDLNRKDTINYTIDLTLVELTPEHPNWDKCKKAIEGGQYSIDDIKEKYDINQENEKLLCNNSK